VGLDDLIDRVPPTNGWDPLAQSRTRDPVAQALPQRVPLSARNSAAAQRGIVLAARTFEYDVAAGRPRADAHSRTPPQHQSRPEEAYARAEVSAVSARAEESRSR
jgi:hypothetical protein